jgi:Uma2 family endonuclease
MTEAASLGFVTFEDYLAAEQNSEWRHEWVAGAVFVMAGGSERHDIAAIVLLDTLRPDARRSGCRTFAGNRLLKVDAASYYPDLMIVCGDHLGHRLYETDAALIVEVRSESTAGRDRREKALVYSSLPSLQHYLLVDPDRRHIEVGERAGRFLSWETYGPGDAISTGYGVLVVDDLYDAIDDEALTPPST